VGAEEVGDGHVKHNMVFMCVRVAKDGGVNQLVETWRRFNTSVILVVQGCQQIASVGRSVVCGRVCIECGGNKDHITGHGGGAQSQNPHMMYRGVMCGAKVPGQGSTQVELVTFVAGEQYMCRGAKWVKVAQHRCSVVQLMRRQVVIGP
jgi:hypothetical protein